MGQSYNIKLKKGDVEIEVHGPDKDFVSNKFKESILVAFDKPEAVKVDVNQLPVHVAQENTNVEAKQEAPVETSQVVESAEPAAEISHPASVVNETVEAVQAEAVPVQEVVVESVQPVVQEPIQEAAEVVNSAEPIVEAAVVTPVESAQVPRLSKAALASVAQVNEDALSKVYIFKKDGFKVSKEFSGTTALKQTNMTKLVLIASEYVNGVAQLSGKAIGKHMKAIGTGNLATNLKKDNGIVKDKSVYRLNEAGKQSALELIKSLAQS